MGQDIPKLGVLLTCFQCSLATDLSGGLQQPVSSLWALRKRDTSNLIYCEKYDYHLQYPLDF